MTTVRWWHRPTRMASAAQFGWCILFGLGLFSAVMMVVVGYESADWKAITMYVEVGVAVGAWAYLARMIGWNDLANNILGQSPNSDSMNQMLRTAMVVLAVLGAGALLTAQ